MTEEEQLKANLKKLAASFKYPLTPDLTKPPVETGRFGWRVALAAVVLAVALAAAFSIPPVRAALVEIFGVGSVEVVLGVPTPTAPRIEVYLPGETTLEAARAASTIPVPLPPALGAPDRVFVLSQLANTVVLVWEDDRIALYVIPPGPLIRKLSPENVEETRVNGEPAVWTSGDHFLELLESDPEKLFFITSHVLVWEDQGVTFRLETDLPLVDAIVIAESLEQ